MRNEICNYCSDKRGFCFLSCKKYKEAQLKRAERRIQKSFGDDFNAEDRYAASLIFFFTVAGLTVLLMLFCTVKVIGEWLA